MERMQGARHPHSFTLRSRSAFAITHSELALIAAAASIGESKIPNAG